MREQDPVTSIKGIGPKSADVFRKAGIATAGDLVRYYPRDYITYSRPSVTSEAQEGYHITLDGRLSSRLNVHYTNRKMSVASGRFRDDFGEIRVVWFNMPYLKQSLVPGKRVILRGRVKRSKAGLVLEQPEIFTPEAYKEKQKALQPVYVLSGGLKNGALTKAVRTLFEGDDPLSFSDALPSYLQEKHALMPLADALYQIHFPEDDENFLLARRRLAFEEFFFFLLALRYGRTQRPRQKNAFSFPDDISKDKYLNSLAFELTEAQKAACADIFADMTGPYTMNRLLQGDVGSGKTAVAVLALLRAADNGCQGAFMAPTEILAKQHASGIAAAFKKAGIPHNVVLLTGSMTAAQKRVAREQIESGNAAVIVGTHALIQESVHFHKLALVITDEQHRFGVRQREELQKKGEDPHILVMSATPIPRTLALILYGDLDISVMRGMPKDRLPIKNALVDTAYREKAYQFIYKQIREGHQAYIICPFIEESESMDGEDVIGYTEKIRGVFPGDVRIASLYGSMPQAEKDAVMEDFAANRAQILVSTTVVEVGVDVPNATVMLVENAERFGLSALHQLRGRIGRGSSQSYCIFVSGKQGEENAERLKVLCETNDGFVIAEKDLALRGPGDFFGTRQSGILSFRLADIYTDAALLKEADQAVADILEKDPALLKEENAPLKTYLKEKENESVTL